jgi:hypothetical protein
MYGTHVANRLVEGQGSVRRWPGRIIASKEAPVGVEPTSSCFAGSRRAVWLQRQVVSALARSRAWSSTFAGSRANPPHSEDVFLFSAPPRNRTSSGSFEDCHAIRHTRRACVVSVSTRNRTWIWTFGGSYAIHYTIETFSVPTWSRTRARALGEPRAIHYTIGTYNQSRRLDLHQHDAVYRTAAFLNRATSAPQAGVRGVEPRWAALEAASSPRRTLLYRPSALRPGTIGVTTTLAASRSSTLR